MKILDMVMAVFALFAIVMLPVAATNQVYLTPQQSNATYCSKTDVEIWANATDFAGGVINLTYNPACANVTKWAKNAADFPQGGWTHYNGRVYIDFYNTSVLYSGKYLIGTLTIQCVKQNEDCVTVLAFVEPSKLRNDIGQVVTASWKNGTFTCGELQQCLGTCCNNSDCTIIFATDILCNECINQGKYWKPNKDSACFNDNPTSDLCLSWCPQCCNGDDDDSDTKIDFPADIQCTCGLDPSESKPSAPVPELPTIALFSLGLLALTGYVLRKRA